MDRDIDIRKNCYQGKLVGGDKLCYFKLNKWTPTKIGSRHIKFTRKKNAGGGNLNRAREIKMRNQTNQKGSVFPPL